MFCLFFFLNDTATTEFYTYQHPLSLHDALPIGVRALQPDLAAIAQFNSADDTVGVAVFGREPAGSDAALAVRCFCPADGIPEDPVTGSANEIGRAHV